MKKLILIFAVLFLTISCGYKDDLYIPDDKEQPKK